MTLLAYRWAPPSPRWSGKAEHAPAESMGFRHLWGQAKLSELTETSEAEPAALYDTVEPMLQFGTTVH